MSHVPRATWTQLTDAQLLEQCAVDTYRASGPGGQKRNKTSSAVRLRHLPTSLLVIAEESRSQHENRAKALKRLRDAFYLKLRDEPAPEQCAQRPELTAALDGAGRVHLSKRDPRFWPLVGLVLDVLDVQQARVAETAALLGLSTGNLISLLETSPKVWEQVNQLRARHGQKTLRPSS